MWGRTKTSQPVESDTARERLVSILGLTVEGAESTGGRPNPTKAVVVDTTAQQIQPDVAASDGFSAAIGALAGRLTHDTDEALPRELAPAGRKAASDTFGEAAQLSVATYTQPHPVLIPERELTDLPAESQRLLEERTKLFQDQLGGIVNKTLCQSEAAVHSSVARLETYFAQAKQIESTMDEKLANLSRSALQAVQTQTKVLEGEMSKIAEQVGSQITAALEPATSWIQNYRAQADEINSALEASLKRFTQKAAEAALLRTRLFQESLATISEQVVSETEQTLHSRMTQIREMASRSLEDEMASVSERLQQSHAQSLQTRLDEILAASRVRVETLQQQSGTISTEFLGRMRTDSEVIATELHDRFQSDAGVLEAKMVDTIRDRLQKLTEEFRSIFDALQQDSLESARR